MSDLDTRLLLRQLHLKPDESEEMEANLVKWFKEWHKAGRPCETRAGKVAGKMATVSGIFTRCQP